MPTQGAVRRAVRQAALGAALPAAAGALIALLALAGQPVEGPWQWTVRALLLAPAVLVHCCQRPGADMLGLTQTLVVSVAAGLCAYAVAAVGLAAGAAVTLAVAVAAQTGALAAAAQLAGLLSLALTLRGRRTA